MRHQRVMLYLLFFVVYGIGAWIMSKINPILWYVLHTQLMAEFTNFTISLLPGDDSGFAGPSHIQGMIVRNIHH